MSTKRLIIIVIFIFAGKNSSATIIEDYTGLPAIPYHTNVVTEMMLNEEAHVTHYKIQREGLAAFHTGI